MALPTNVELQTMDYASYGRPFVTVPSNNTVNTFTMDWASYGGPFVTNPAVSGPTNIGGYDGVTSTNIQTISGVTYTNLETIMGVT